MARLAKLTIGGLLVAVLGAGCKPQAVAMVGVEPVRVTASLDLGRSWVGFSVERDFEVINPNQVAVPLALSTTEPFAVLEGADQLPAGASLRARLGFHPVDAGPFAAQLLVNDQVVQLTGEGVWPLDCAPPSACTTVAFSPDAGTCLTSARPDGLDCTSSNGCFTSAHCERGQCVGTLTSCDDHNACTLDVCGEGGCAHLDALPQCPLPAALCFVATCDADAGCGSAPAPDGTSCGPSDCMTAQVCIGGACITRPVPQGQPCPVAECVDAGVQCGALLGNGRVVLCGACSSGQVCDARSRTCTTPAVACTASGAACGTTLDACGLDVTCPNTCPGSCVGSTCGPACTPVTCAAAGTECGVSADGCGSIVCCGSCDFPYQCNALTPGRCDLPLSIVADAGTCVPRTCASLGATCGTPADGCGGTLHCGVCTAPEVCGAAGTNRCGPVLEAECGPLRVGDQLVNCGGCPSGMTCGGGGPYRCGVGACQPLTCVQQGASPGLNGNGCGELLDCYSGNTPPVPWCLTPLFKGCVPKPLACRQLGFNCGVVQSACGPSVDCGTCLAPQTCQNNRCR